MTQETDSQSRSDLTACPNCGNMNRPNVLICPACGVRVDLFESAQEALDAKSQAVQVQRRAVFAETATKEEEEEQQNVRRKLWRFWLPIVLLATGLLALPIWLFASNAGASERQKKEMLQSLLLKAEDCIKAQDFSCARDTYTELIQLDPLNEVARKGLWSAQVGLARDLAKKGQIDGAIEALTPARKATPQDEALIDLEVSLRGQKANQLARKGDWRAAIDMQSAALELKPNDSGVRNQIRTFFDQWIVFERAKGNITQAVMLQIEKKARFP